MEKYITCCAKETEAVAEKLAKGFTGGELILFTGGLGAGKTTFCKGIARGLGCSGHVSSPTFSIVNYYKGTIGFAHFDFYRLTSQEDLETAGFYDYVDSGAVIAVEWSELICIPPEAKTYYIDIRTIDAEKREITIVKP